MTAPAASGAGSADPEPVPAPAGEEAKTARRRAPVLAVGGVVAALVGALLLGGVVASAGEATALRIGPEVPATATHHEIQPANNSPVLMADPTEPRFVVVANRLDAPRFSCALQVSGDGGRSWVPATPVPRLPPGADTCYAPEVGFDRNGVLYYLFVGLAGIGNEPMGVYLASSTDRGQTFSAPQLLLGPNNFAVRMAIDQRVGTKGRIHLVWLRARSDPPLGGFPEGPNPILAAHSDDGGRTFSHPVQVSDARRQRVVAPALALGPGGAVHVAYYDLGDDARDYQGLQGPTYEGTWALVAASSTDAGRTFAQGVVVDDSIVPQERVMLIFTMPPAALVADNERLCTAWTDARHGDADVLLRCSSDRGGRWGPLRRLNDDPPGNGLRQYLPRLAAADGRIDAVFLDRRFDPQNRRNDVSYTYSTDGGRTFAPNRRLTRESSLASIGQQYVGPAAENQVEWGGRLGLLSAGRTVVAAWPDTRYSASPGTGQDLYVGHVRFVPERQRSWTRVVGGVVVAGVLVVLAAARRGRGRAVVAGS